MGTPREDVAPCIRDDDRAMLVVLDHRMVHLCVRASDALMAATHDLCARRAVTVIRMCKRERRAHAQSRADWHVRACARACVSVRAGACVCGCLCVCVRACACAKRASVRAARLACSSFPVLIMSSSISIISSHESKYLLPHVAAVPL